MVTIINKQREIEKIESNLDIDFSLFKKRSNATTLKGYMLQKMKEAKAEKNFDLVAIIQHFYKKAIEFEKHEEILLKGWKGKSSLSIINKPDYFVITTYQKENQDTEAHQVNRDITKIEVNRIINVLNELNQGKRISTRDIGERAYKRDWDSIFSDRFLHINLNLILRLLNYYGLTSYRGKYTTVLKPVREIQEVLK